MDSVVNATSYDWGSPERDAIALAYRNSYKVQALAILIVAILALLISLPIKNIELNEEDE